MEKQTVQKKKPKRKNVWKTFPDLQLNSSQTQLKR